MWCTSNTISRVSRGDARQKLKYDDWRSRWLPPRGEVVEKIQAAGFPRFSMHDHTQLWKKCDAKKDGKGLGCPGDYKGSWVWFDRWVDEVISHCEAEGDRYH